MLYKNSERGRSMVEMIGYLMVVMGVIIAMGRIVSSAFDNHKYSTASLQLTEFVGALVKASAVDVDYTSVVKKVKTADGAKELVPNTYRVVGNTIYHAFGGTVDVSCAEGGVSKQCSDSATEFSSSQFAVKYEKLSKKQCVELGMKSWIKNQYADLFSMTVNDSVWYWKAYGDKDGKAVSIDEGNCQNKTCVMPVMRSKLTGTGDNDGQCKDGRQNTIIWVFN